MIYTYRTRHLELPFMPAEGSWQCTVVLVTLVVPP
jgi:hypothetical protein